MNNKTRVFCLIFGAASVASIIQVAQNTNDLPDLNESAPTLSESAARLTEAAAKLSKAAAGLSEANANLSEAVSGSDYRLATTLPPGVLSLDNTIKVLGGFDAAQEAAELVISVSNSWNMINETSARMSAMNGASKNTNHISEYGNNPTEYLETPNGELNDIDFMTGFVIQKINNGSVQVHVGLVLDTENSIEENYRQIEITRDTAKYVVWQHQDKGAHFDTFFALQPSRGFEAGTIIYFMGDQNGLFFDNIDDFETAFGDDFSQWKHILSRAQLAVRQNAPNYIPAFNGVPIPIL